MQLSRFCCTLRIQVLQCVNISGSVKGLFSSEALFSFVLLVENLETKYKYVITNSRMASL